MLAYHNEGKNESINSLSGMMVIFFSFVCSHRIHHQIFGLLYQSRDLFQSEIEPGISAL